MYRHAAIASLLLALGCGGGLPPGNPSGPTSPSRTPSSTATKVLFIGNSLTYSNDLPGMFRQLATAGRKDVFVDQITPPGMTLQGHARSSETFQKIESQPWDFVLLQSNDIVAFPDLYEQELSAVATLTRAILANNARTTIVYEMVFGLRNGVTLRELDGSVVTYTYQDYIGRIHDGTLFVADRLNLIIAPVGWAWQFVVKERPQTVLFDSDNAHPALRGSYLGACVFYTTLFRESAVGLGYHAGLTPDEGSYLQQIATSTVLSSPGKWHIPTS